MIILVSLVISRNWFIHLQLVFQILKCLTRRKWIFSKGNKKIIRFFRILRTFGLPIANVKIFILVFALPLPLPPLTNSVCRLCYIDLTFRKMHLYKRTFLRRNIASNKVKQSIIIKWYVLRRTCLFMLIFKRKV